MLVEQAASLGILHVVLALTACRMNGLWGQGSFHPDFRRSFGDQPVCPGRPIGKAVKVQ